MPQRKNRHDQPIGTAVPGWSERVRPTRRILAGRYCRLAPVDPPLHAEELFAAYSEAPDDRDWTYLFAERPPTPAMFGEYLAKLAAGEDPLHFTIIDESTGKPGGTAALMRIDPVHGVIEVGSINYSPRLKQTRAGSEAMYLLMHHAFDDLGYRRYEWKCDSLNAASRVAAERYGFTYEGLFRSAVVYKGRSRDTAWFSILAEEWPRICAAFETWLNPDNFDAAGRQRHRLSIGKPTRGSIDPQGMQHLAEHGGEPVKGPRLVEKLGNPQL
jgi:RimJ/RimL family protein N-acetyltransferase